MMLSSIDFFSVTQCLLKEKKKNPLATLHQGPQKNIKNTYVDELSNPTESVQKLIYGV